MATEVRFVEICRKCFLGHLLIHRLALIENHTPFEQTEMTLAWGSANDGVNDGVSDGVSDGVTLTNPQQEFSWPLPKRPQQLLPNLQAWWVSRRALLSARLKH